MDSVNGKASAEALEIAGRLTGGIESVLRGGVIGLLATWVRALALIAGVILFVNYWQLAVIVAAIAAGIFVLRANVSELLDGSEA